MGNTFSTGDRPQHPVFQCSALEKNPPNVTVCAHWSHSTAPGDIINTDAPYSPQLCIPRVGTAFPRRGQSPQDESTLWAQHTFPRLLKPQPSFNRHKESIEWFFLGQKMASSPLQTPSSRLHCRNHQPGAPSHAGTLLVFWHRNFLFNKLSFLQLAAVVMVTKLGSLATHQ